MNDVFIIIRYFALNFFTFAKFFFYFKIYFLEKILEIAKNEAAIFKLLKIMHFR